MRAAHVLATAVLLVIICSLLGPVKSRFQMTSWKKLAKEPADAAEQQ